MAALNIVALSEDVLASPGNREPNYIVISVTDSDGRPISKLEGHDFAVKSIVAPRGGTVNHIVSVAESDFPGVYLMEVVPEGKDLWKAGVYIFAIGVHRGFDRGQTVLEVLMD